MQGSSREVGGRVKETSELNLLGVKRSHNMKSINKEVEKEVGGGRRKAEEFSLDKAANSTSSRKMT